MWGALRYQAPLPWDTDVDLGVQRKDIERVPKNLFRYFFYSKNISIYYSTWGGYYRVTRNGARADLMLFDYFSNNGYIERVGLESYIFYVNYKKMHAFPSRLVQKPLPMLPFAGRDMPVPRDGLEVQKYHYPYDWWKESKPIGC